MNPIPSLALVFATFIVVSAAPVSWPQFRGPNSSGIAEKQKPPIHFGADTNLLWNVKIGPGLSSPCIVGDRIFLTSFEDNKIFVLGIDRGTGRELWRKAGPETKPEEVHRVSSPAVATPASDGERVYVYFPTFGLFGYDLSGKEVWRKPFSKGHVNNGSGTSPAIINDLVVLTCDRDEGESFIIAVEGRTGKTRWQKQREIIAGSYTTPVLWKRGELEDVVAAGSLRVTGYDVRDGKERWNAAVLTSVAVTPTPVVGGDQIYVMSFGVPPNAMGTFEDFVRKSDKDSDGKISEKEAPPGFEGSIFRSLDKDKDGFVTNIDWSAMTNLFGKGTSGLFALKVPGSGDITDTHVAWRQTRGIAAYSSPLFHDGRLYSVQDGGRVTCWNTATGKPLYEQERLGADGEYYASPIMGGETIYMISTKGVVTAITPGDSLEVKARNQIGEAVMATPAIADNKLYVRSAEHLWAFGGK